ncbi:MAG: orotate phosphoribosyltransferase [Pseudomonadota bacterium]
MAYKKEFIEFATNSGALQFGEYTLKSGRKSPYFFNSGVFKTGSAMSRLGEFYAHAIVESKISFDMLFGPAYKGIPLVTSTAIALSQINKLNIPFAFNRKEKKDYGDQGKYIGAKIEGEILIVDDVLTAGTAIKESAEIINTEGGSLVGVIILLDRQERGSNNLSAIQEIEDSLSIQVISIINITDIIEYLSNKKGQEGNLTLIKEYQEKYGIK